MLCFPRAYLPTSAAHSSSFHRMDAVIPENRKWQKSFPNLLVKDGECFYSPPLKYRILAFLGSGS